MLQPLPLFISSLSLKTPQSNWFNICDQGSTHALHPPVESAVLSQDHVREDHDKDGRAEDDGGSVTDRQAREPDEDAGHRQAADQTWQSS